ncbi:MAG: branched-chain amino acid transporter substrate-binding protein [Acidimicrobiales bacterium]|nr:branched-chain amino acid transporter substrate-binding protein [Acidimicrobiales bacterium]
MSPKRTTRFAAVVLAAALVASGCGSSRKSSSSGGGGGGGGKAGSDTAALTSKCDAYNGTQGISGDTIKIGSSLPRSGPYAPYDDLRVGWQAYFDKVNKDGGVPIAGKKYKIQLEAKDDASDAGKTKSNYLSLVQKDGVFLTFGIVGTPNNKSIMPDVAQGCVPNLFANTGATLVSTDNQWSQGALTPYVLEATTFAQYLKQNKPNAKVAVLYQNDDFGKAYLGAFQRAIAGTKITITAKESYELADQDVKSQVTNLSATKADTWLLAASALKCSSGLQEAKNRGWQPLTYGSGVCAAKILLTIAGPAADKLLSSGDVKDPNDPQYASDPAMKEYVAAVKASSSKADVTNGVIATGYTEAANLVGILKTAKAADRAAVMVAAHNVAGLNAGLLYDDIKLKTGANDDFLSENLHLTQYDAKKGYGTQLGKLWVFEGKTSSLAG